MLFDIPFSSGKGAEGVGAVSIRKNFIDELYVLNCAHDIDGPACQEVLGGVLSLVTIIILPLVTGNRAGRHRRYRYGDGLCADSHVDSNVGRRTLRCA